MRSRAERRTTSFRVASKRRKVRARMWAEYLIWTGGSPRSWDRPGGPKHLSSALYYSKNTLGCSCRGRRYGQPKLGQGSCCSMYRPSWRERKAGRKLVREWAAWEGPLDDCEA